MSSHWKRVSDGDGKAFVVETGHVIYFHTTKISNVSALRRVPRSARRGVVTFFSPFRVRAIVSCYPHSRRDKFFIFPPKFFQLFLPKHKKVLLLRSANYRFPLRSCIALNIFTYFFPKFQKYFLEFEKRKNFLMFCDTHFLKIKHNFRI